MKNSDYIKVRVPAENDCNGCCFKSKSGCSKGNILPDTSCMYPSEESAIIKAFQNKDKVAKVRFYIFKKK